MEEIIAFLPGQFPHEERFAVEMAGITHPDPKYRIQRNNSQILLLEYVIAGRGKVYTEGKTFYPKAGDVYLLPMGSTHIYESDPGDPWEKIWMNLKGNLPASLASCYGLSHQILFQNAPLLPWFQRFLNLCRKEKKEPARIGEKAPFLVHELMMELSKTLRDNRSGSTDPAESARQFLDSKIYSKATLEETAAAAGLSPSQLTRVFRKTYGQTPYQYLLERKLEAACLLLKNTNLPVQEIAWKLSFSDPQYFSNLFREKNGCPPGGYRKNFR